VKKQIEKLARETALYSISSILGKFLNWMMVPLYTYVLPRSADYGIITNLYSWTALLLVFLTYGMERAFCDLPTSGAMKRIKFTVLR
jgi:O-antigen/teichoic acid export membrane protein